MKQVTYWRTGYDLSGISSQNALKVFAYCQGWSYVMPMKTNNLPMETKSSNQLIKPLHIAPNPEHQLCKAQGWVHTLNVSFLITCCQEILLNLLPRNFVESVAKLPDVHTCLLLWMMGLVFKLGPLQLITTQYNQPCQPC